MLFKLSFFASFDNNAQLGPVLELWQQLTSSTPGLINRRGGASANSSTAHHAGPAGGAAAGAGAHGANKKVLDSVDDFVNMENDLAGDICALVDTALAALKKVRHL